jgi:hypothetical protein
MSEKYGFKPINLKYPPKSPANFGDFARLFAPLGKGRAVSFSRVKSQTLFFRSLITNI